LRILVSLLVFCGFVLSAACQSIPSESVEPASQTAIPESPTENTSTQVLTPALTQEETDMPPIPLPDEAAEKLVTLVKQNLAQRLNIAIDQIVLLEIKSVVWRDASLGCPKPAIDYIRVETPGYRIVLEASGQTYNYHTDQVKRFVMCNRQ
jgi:hypothetical protein